MWTGSEIEIDLYLIRHGATKSNKRHAYLGVTDEELCEEGKKELFSYQASGCYPDDVQVFCGPMLRCRQTAQLLYPSCTPVLILQWTEIDFGRFEGKTYKELNGDAEYQRWIDSGGTIAFVQGESREAFQKRTMEGFKACIDLLKRSPKPAAAMVHGGTIMAVISSLTGGEYYDYQVKNGKGYHLTLALSETGVKLKKLRALEEIRTEQKIKKR